MKVGDRVVCILSDDSWSGDVVYKDKEYIITDYTNTLFTESTVKVNANNSWWRVCDFRKVEPKTNAISKELAEEFIETEKQLKEIDVPERVFTLKEKF